MPRNLARRPQGPAHRGSRATLRATPRGAPRHPCAGRVPGPPCGDLLHLYRAAPVLMLTTDASGAVMSMSDLLVDRLGRPGAQWLAAPAAALFDTPGRARFEREVWPALLADGRLQGAQLRLAVGADGAALDVVLSGYVVPGPEGAPRGTVLFAHDITVHRQHAAQLEAERRRLDDILTATDAGTWEWNVATGAVRLDARWASMLGHTLASLGPPHVDTTWLRLTHPADLDRCLRALQQHFDGGAPLYECTFRMRHRLGHWVWILARGKVIRRTADGRVEWMLGTHLDITAVKQQQARLQQAERMLDRVGESATIGGYEADLDTGLMLPTPQACRLLGREAVSPAPLSAWLLRLDALDRRRLLRAALRGRRTGAAWQLDVAAPAGPAAGGGRRTLQVTGRHEPGADGQPRTFGSVQDVTESRDLARRLDQQQRLLQVTLNAIADAVITIDSGGRPDWMNSAAAQLLSATSDRPDRLPADVEQAARACLRLGDALGSPQPIRLRTHQGEDLSLDFSASPIHLARDAPPGAVIVLRNVTQQQRSAEAMAWRASHDVLTGLVNRAEFEHRLDAALARVSATGVPHALLYVDLDQFKLVNDGFGHPMGDVLLQQVAALITGCVRTGDTVARVGGDEFAIVLAGCDAAQAQRAGQEICDRLDSYRFPHEGRRLRVGASIGLVSIDHRVFPDAGAVLKAADAACFAAKDSGRNRVHTWLADDAAIAGRRGEMQWVARIEQALDEDRFELHGQRIVPLAGPEAGLHVELLLRLREADGQLVSPGAFIPAAERFNLSPRLDAWVVRAALDWLTATDDLERFSLVSVNLSGSSVGDPLFREAVVHLLRQQRAAVRRRICLEITETSAVTHMDNARALVDQVRALGVSVALDDFGAGASSFGYLRQLRVDFIKIDGQYVRDLLDDPLDSAAIKCFVEVARVTGVRTVAEFVEREDVLLELRRLGVDFGQGYLLHRPQPLHHLGTTGGGTGA